MKIDGRAAERAKEMADARRGVAVSSETRARMSAAKRMEWALGRRIVNQRDEDGRWTGANDRV